MEIEASTEASVWTRAPPGYHVRSKFPLTLSKLHVRGGPGRLIGGGEQSPDTGVPSNSLPALNMELKRDDAAKKRSSHRNGARPGRARGKTRAAKYKEAGK